MQHHRRLAVGAEVQPAGGVHFRVWAPLRQRVEVLLDAGAAVILGREEHGFFSGFAAAAGPGTRYRFRLDGGTDSYPDPASRFQPDGPHGPSQVVDPSRFPWTDQGWRGVGLHGQILYEMHVGTFTRAGTWAAAAKELPELAADGITVLEVMPVADFPGRFGWGYDGVNLFAPTRLYGDPDDFRSFVDRAHAAGLGVLLDVVYNHLGPDGNYLRQFAPAYFTDRYKNEWGEAINFDGPDAGPVRDFFVANAGYWIAEFHLDGLRLDATQQIFDASPEHILTAMRREVRRAASGRETILVAENEEQEAKLVRPPERGGYGLDAVWNDDFHHSATVALTGRSEAYYADFRGDPQELLSAVKWGYLFQGQYCTWRPKPRGSPTLDLSPAAFVVFLQNHDQVANSARGLRLHLLSSPGRYRALTALFLLGPGTPMLFQGQEFAASSPFFFFADHNPDLAKLVYKGRTKFLSKFPSITDPEVTASLPDPSCARTFESCKLDFTERELHRETYALHRDLMKLRRDDPAFRAQQPRGVDGAVLGPHAFLLRYFTEDGMDRLLLVNLGRDLNLAPCPEPLLAPPEGVAWQVHWSSESPHYGGNGRAPLAPAGWLHLQGETAVVLVPQLKE
jgi:maltooligosyltrehalose trehalohydrolase